MDSHSIEFECEFCGAALPFLATGAGSIQACRECFEYVDVPERTIRPPKAGAAGGTTRRTLNDAGSAGPARLAGPTGSSPGNHPKHPSPYSVHCGGCAASVTIDTMSDVTRVLCQIESGDPSAAEQLLPLVYDELRKLAAAKLSQEKPGQTLQATALVHEAFLRLVDVEAAPHWNGRGHFFGAAAEAMRRILLNRARDRRRLKRGREFSRVDLENVELAVDAPPDNLLEIDEAIARLANENPECAEVVKLRFFAGLSIDEAAAAVGISASTAKRHWVYARAWLFDALRPDDQSSCS